MARTKQEVRDFLNSLVGQSVNAQSGIYRGQCVSLIKALLDFLGAPNPYAGRGNAIDVGDTLLRQGLARNGAGWLNVVVNRSMGRIFENGVWNQYGHIWLDLRDEANFEQNGARALYTTKNTRPISQAQQIVNLDQYITEGASSMAIIQNAENWYQRMNITHRAIRGRDLGRDTFAQFVGKDFLTFVEVCEDDPEANMVSNWQNVGQIAVRDKWDQQIYGLQDQLKAANGALANANSELAVATQQVKELGSRPTPEQLAAATKQLEDAQKTAAEAHDQYEKILAQYNAIKSEQDKNEAASKSFLQVLGDFLRTFFSKEK